MAEMAGGPVIWILKLKLNCSGAAMKKNSLTPEEMGIKLRSFLKKYDTETIEIDGIKFVLSGRTLIDPVPGVRLGEFKIELSFAGLE